MIRVSSANANISSHGNRCNSACHNISIYAYLTPRHGPCWNLLCHLLREQSCVVCFVVVILTAFMFWVLLLFASHLRVGCWTVFSVENKGVAALKMISTLLRCSCIFQDKGQKEGRYFSEKGQPFLDSQGVPKANPTSWIVRFSFPN